MKRTWIMIVGGLLLFTLAAFAQRRGGGFGGGFGGRAETSSDFHFPDKGEFHFLRLEYSDNRGGGFRNVSRRGQANGWWAQDYPDAENHFTVGLQRLTRLDISEPQHTGLIGDEIFEHPWAYSTQNNYMIMSEDEITQLREWLNRGGFLMTDDMYDSEGEGFYEIVKQVFPEQQVEAMSEDDPVMNVHYSIRDADRTFIPGERHLQGGGRVSNVGTPGWFKVADAKGHVVIAINANTDMGDAWEYADAPYYPAEMTTLAYHYGINYVIYAMTH
jgi:hypothetical protein